MTQPVRQSVSRLVDRWVGLSVGLSVIIFEQGGKLHFHDPIGALVS